MGNPLPFHRTPSHGVGFGFPFPHQHLPAIRAPRESPVSPARWRPSSRRPFPDRRRAAFPLLSEHRRFGNPQVTKGPSSAPGSLDAQEAFRDRARIPVIRRLHAESGIVLPTAVVVRLPPGGAVVPERHHPGTVQPMLDAVPDDDDAPPIPFSRGVGQVFAAEGLEQVVRRAGRGLPVGDVNAVADGVLSRSIWERWGLGSYRSSDTRRSSP
jgi:hypothetical protein